MPCHYTINLHHNINLQNFRDITRPFRTKCVEVFSTLLLWLRFVGLAVHYQNNTYLSPFCSFGKKTKQQYFKMEMMLPVCSISSGFVLPLCLNCFVLVFMEGVLASSEGRSSEPPSVVPDEELLFREITKRSIISNCMVMAGNVFWHQIAKCS